MHSCCDLLIQGLTDHGFEVVSTGGSAAALEKAGVPVQRVEQLTGFPEMLDGVCQAAVHADMLACSCLLVSTGFAKSIVLFSSSVSSVRISVKSST